VPVGNTAIQTFLNGAKAKDGVDSKPVITNNAPATFIIGATEVTFTATDKTGNTGICTATVSVVDTTAPVFTTRPVNIIVEALGPEGVRADAIQTFLSGAKATDIVDGEMIITNDAPAMFSVGTTKVVTFTATDKALKPNTASCTATVSVVDTTPPVITCPPANITVEIVGQNGAPVSDVKEIAGVKATDIADSAVSVTNNAPAVFSIGITEVTFIATDKFHNTASCKATVTVKMKCCGDVNLDGQLTTADALVILKCYLETGTCNEYLDVNGDGNISLKDAECVLNRYLERPSCLDDTCGSISK
jgi:hypothetical protein